MTLQALLRRAPRSISGRIAAWRHSRAAEARPARAAAAAQSLRAERATRAAEFWRRKAAAGRLVGPLASAAVAIAVYAAIQALAPRRPTGFGASDEDGDATTLARSAAPGRGRDAVSPYAIPWAGWKDILWRTWREAGQDRLLAIAAGVVFFGLLALFPAITALVSSYGLFASPAQIAGHVEALATLLPPGAFSVVRDQIERVLANGEVRLGLKFGFGLALALWSANAGMKAIIDALNVVYDEEEKRGFFKLNAVSLAFTTGAIASTLAAIGAVVVAPVVFGWLQLTPGLQNLLSYGRWPALFLLMAFGLAVLYRFGPSRRRARWEWLSVGALVATALWVAGSAALSVYVSRFANYDATYGSLGAAIGLMMWLWLSSTVVLIGAELNAEIEHQTARDSTVGGEKPLGLRGAQMADTVGKPAD